MNLQCGLILFCAGVVLGFACGRWKWEMAGGKWNSGKIASAALDEEGWVLLDADGGVQPWPDDWPPDVEGGFFAKRGWTLVNLGTAAHPKEGWIAP